jgi:hypothetical protein
MESYFVKLPGVGTCTFTLPREEYTVGGLISAVNSRLNVRGVRHYKHSATLFYAGKELRSKNKEELLSSIGIFPGSTLEVHVPLRGGAQLGKFVKGRAKERSGEAAAEYASKMKWLQDQAAQRVLGAPRRTFSFKSELSSLIIFIIQLVIP